jgi:hypothetical protein
MTRSTIVCSTSKEDIMTTNTDDSVSVTRAIGDRARVPWKHVVVFALFAYAIAWAVWSSLWPSINDALSNGRTASKIDLGGITVLGMFAPAIAAVVMRAFVSKEGFKGSLGPVRHRWRFYIAAFLGAVALVATLSGLAELGIGNTDLKKWGYIGPAMLLIGIPIGTALAFGEEYGWRGYLLPKLLPLGDLKASFVVALIWAPWHLPVLLAGLNYPGRSIPLVLAVFGLSTVALSLLHTRFFVAAGMSVMVASVLHGSLNTLSDNITDSSHIAGNPLLISGGGIIATGMVAIAVLGAYVVSRIRRGSPEINEPAEEPAMAA